MRIVQTPILFLDCQTTARQPTRGGILELCWVVASVEELRSQGLEPTVSGGVVRLPEGEGLPREIQKMTGISPEELEGAPTFHELWLQLLEGHPRPEHSVIHYARFELAFLEAALRDLQKPAELPWRTICAHQVAKKLLPDLPAWGIRALSGYFGRPLPEQQRAPSNVLATLRIWSNLVERLGWEGVESWEDLESWLKAPKRRKAARPSYLLPRETRLSLPASPGVYRMLSSDGKVLYVGKARKLKDRVNSYFRKGTGKRERMPELLTQVWDLRVTEAETPLEAALLENDEIKRHNPPYNVALRAGNRRLNFFSRDFRVTTSQPDRGYPKGPFPSIFVFQSLELLVGAVRKGENLELNFPGIDEPEVFASGLTLFLERHHLPEARLYDVKSCLTVGLLLLRRQRLTQQEDEEQAEVGTDSDADLPEQEAWTPELVAETIERRLLREARQLERARWLCRLTEMSLSWRPPQAPESQRRRIRVHEGRIIEQVYAPAGEQLPVPEGWSRPYVERQRDFDLVVYDRMRILLSEIRRLLQEGHEVKLRLSPERELAGASLQRFLGRL